MRWKNGATTLLTDYEALLEYLFTEDYEVSTAYRQAQFNGETQCGIPSTMLDTIRGIWQQLLPHRKLTAKAGRIEVRMGNDSEGHYTGTEMSDGERVIFYLIGQCLAAPQDGILIIDEPELHLHRSVQSRLWDAIEAARPDCLFVYLTHDLAFASTRSNAQRIWIRSFDGKNWDWRFVPRDIESFPEDVLLEVLGGRKPVLFIEGDRSSLDYLICSHVYPDHTIQPRGSCTHVLHAVQSFRSLGDLHEYDCKGLTDRDARSDQEIEYLSEREVYVLPVSEIENLFLCEPVLKVLMDALLINDQDSAMSRIRMRVVDELRRERELIATRIAISRIERKLGKLDTKVRGEHGLTQAFQSLVSNIDPQSEYKVAAGEIDKILSVSDYAAVLMLYANKGLLPLVAPMLRLNAQGFKDYVASMFKSQHRDALVAALRQILPDISN